MSEPVGLDFLVSCGDRQNPVTWKIFVCFFYLLFIFLLFIYAVRRLQQEVCRGRIEYAAYRDRVCRFVCSSSFNSAPVRRTCECSRTFTSHETIEFQLKIAHDLAKWHQTFIHTLQSKMDCNLIIILNSPRMPNVCAAASTKQIWLHYMNINDGELSVIDLDDFLVSWIRKRIRYLCVCQIAWSCARLFSHFRFSCGVTWCGGELAQPECPMCVRVFFTHKICVVWCLRGKIDSITIPMVECVQYTVWLRMCAHHAEWAAEHIPNALFILCATY